MKKWSTWSLVMMLAFLMCSAAGADASDIAGTWNINFNNYRGTMVISGSEGNYSGRFNLHGNWEDMLDLQVAGGAIYFRRAAADQRYLGTISGNGMSGSFRQGGSGNYPWRADRAVDAAPGAPSIAGTWNINFNNYRGAMVISGSEGNYSGRFNLHGNWEEMLDLRVAGSQISFRRAAADQRYQGTISGNGMSGSFSQGGSGNYPWRADRTGDSASSAAPIAGTWNINFNSYRGTMVISGGEGNYSGRFNLHGNWEEMLDLRVSGGQISFRRAAADQRYQGTISGNGMSGNFSQGGSGNYPWRADRTGG